MTQHLIIPEILVFSKRTWATLSKEDQDLIMKEAKGAQKEQWTLWAEMEKKSVDDMKANGVEIVKLDNTAMADAVKKAVYEKHAKPLIPFIERVQAVK
jgi:TRAP-type C4-dicarboxylate transport system substrate-binding protein